MSIITRIHQICDANNIPETDRFDRLNQVFKVREPKELPVERITIFKWFTGEAEPNEDQLGVLATEFKVNYAWLHDGKGPRYKERIGLNGNQINWNVEQRKLYDFDRGDMRDKAFAWVLLNQPRDVVAEFCSEKNEHDVNGMRVDIRVNDVELPVKRFEDIIANLAEAMMIYKFEQLGLASLEKSAFTQAQTVLTSLHGNVYDALGDTLSKMETMRDTLDTLTRMAWDQESYNRLHAKGCFTVTLPPHPERHYGEVPSKSNRQIALELFTQCVTSARQQASAEDHVRLNALVRSIYHDLTQEEQAYCDANLKEHKAE